MDGQGPNAIEVVEDAVARIKDALNQFVFSCEKYRDSMVEMKRFGNASEDLAVKVDVFHNVFSDLVLQTQQEVETVNSVLSEQTQSVVGKLRSVPNPREERALTEQHISSILSHQAEALVRVSSLWSKKLSDVHSQYKSGDVDTMSWLSAAQTNYSLRQLKPLSRSEIQYLLGASRNSESIGQVRDKVHHNLKTYVEELKKKVDLSFKNLCGGFHNHPGVIEQILRECCSDWESRSAGATPTSSQLDMDMQVRQYLPQCQLRIGDDDVDPATKGQEEENMIEKRQLFLKLLSDIHDKEAFDSFVMLALHHACPTVTHTPSKVAVQLLYGVADFVQVTQHFSRENVVEVRRKGGRVEVITSTLWSLRVDSRVNFLLGECQTKDDLGLVKVKYTQDIDLAAFMENRSELPPPKLTVTLTMAKDPLFLSSSHDRDYWSRNYSIPPHSPGVQQDGHFQSDSFNNVSDSDQGENETGRFMRSRGVRVKKGSKPKEPAAESKHKEGGYSSSDSDKTNTTAHTLTVESLKGPLNTQMGIVDAIQGSSGLTVGALKEQEAKRKKEKPSRTLTLEEASNQRSAVVRKGPRNREDYSNKEHSPGPQAQLDTVIGVLSSKYPSEHDYTYYLGDSVSQTSDYFSTPGSRNSSFRKDMRFSPSSELIRGSGDRTSGSKHVPRGRVTPSSDPWPMQKSDSSASLVLYASKNMDNLTPDWGQFRGDYDYPLDDVRDTVSERSWQGSETSISAAHFRETVAKQPYNVLNGIKKSRSLEDIRKVGPSPCLYNDKWESSQSLAAVGPHGDMAHRYFPDPSDRRARERPNINKSLPGSREGSLDRRGQGNFLPHMIGRPPIPSPGPPPRGLPPHPQHGPPPGPQYHPNSMSPYRMQQDYMDFSPGPSPIGPPFRPPGPPGPMPPPHDGFHGQMVPHPRMPPPHGPPGQLPNWDQSMFQPVPYGNYGPSPQPQPTPPATPPPRDGRYGHPSPHPPGAQFGPHHGPPHEPLPPFHDPRYHMRPRRRSPGPGPGPRGHMGHPPRDQYVHF